MIKARLKLLIILMIAIVNIYGTQSQIFTDLNIAVIDFEGIGIEANQAIIITDKFRDALLENKNYKVMERNIVSEILKEQGFQQTGACNSNSCIIEAGHLLGVNFLIAGRITQVSGIIAFSARLIDISSGAIVSSINFESSNTFLEFLKSDIPSYSNKFSGKITNYFKDQSISTQTGMLFIESIPSGGKIFINGEETGKSTPSTFSNLKIGSYSITIMNKDLTGSSAIDLKSGQLSKCIVNLIKGKASIIISTNPQNSDVYFDGKFISKSPVQIDTIESGNHEIEIKMKGYLPTHEKIFIDANANIKKDFVLRGISHLLFPDFEIGTKIFIDGEYQELPASMLIQTTPGIHNVKFSNDNYYDSTLSINCAIGDTTVLKIKQYPKNGSLKVNTVPIKTLVKLKGPSWEYEVGLSPIEDFSLKPGNYTVSLLHKKYENKDINCTIFPGRTFVINDTLSLFSKDFIKWENAKPRNDRANLLLSGIGIIKLKKPEYGIGFFSIGIISDVFLGISAYQLASHYNQRNEAVMKIEKKYYQDRLDEDKKWVIGSFASSVAIRFVSYLFSNKLTY
jgi:TolB-like protein